MSTDAAPRALDTAVLSERPRRAELRRFWREFVAAHPQVRDLRARFRLLIFTVGAFSCAIGLLAMGVGVTAQIEESGFDEPDQLAGMGVVAGMFVIALVVLVWAARRTRARRSRPWRHWVLARFAARNGLRYLPGPFAGGPPVWRQRGDLIVARAMRATAVGGRPVEWADYELRYGTRGSSHTQFGGWIAIGLRRPLPHIVVRAAVRGSRAFSAAAVPAAAQHLSLEGDFDRHFSVYCPAGYERDALFLFTPDVMQRLIEGAGGWDVEIVDDMLMLVRARDVVTTGAADWIEVMRAAQALTGKLDQWERWRDDRVTVDAAPGALGLDLDTAAVAAPGRRLRMRWATVSGVWLGIAVAVLVGILALSRL